VGEAATVDEAVTLIDALRPEVVLLDVHLPGGAGGGGAEVLRRSSALLDSVRFLALSVSDSAEDVVGVIRAGARGYITKGSSGAEVSRAVAAVAGGDAVFSPRLAGFVLDAFGAVAGEQAASDDELDRLSARDLQRGGDRALHLDQDRGDPRLGRAAQAAALVALRAHRVGTGAQAALAGWPAPSPSATPVPDLRDRHLPAPREHAELANLPAHGVTGRESSTRLMRRTSSSGSSISSLFTWITTQPSASNREIRVMSARKFSAGSWKRL
jgi:CheY-like chemotaxis protein